MEFEHSESRKGSPDPQISERVAPTWEAASYESDVTNIDPRRATEIEPKAETRLARTDDYRADDATADETLLGRLRSAAPEDVLTVEIGELEKTLEEHAAYSELFRDQADAEDADNAREELLAVVDEIGAGELHRVWNAVQPGPNAMNVVASIQREFAQIHPQAYAKLVQDIQLASLQVLDRKMASHPDPETARIGKLVTDVFGQEIMDLHDWRTLVEDPSIAEQRRQLEAERQQMQRQNLERDWDQVWSQIESSIRSEISAALRSTGIEPTESKIRHACNFILQRIKDDQRFQRRLRRHYDSARRAGFYPPQLRATLEADYARRVAIDLERAVQYVVTDYRLSLPKRETQTIPNRTPADVDRSRTVGFRMIRTK